MFHKAVKLEFMAGTILQLTFSTGEVKQFDMKTMFDIYPPLAALTDRSLFISGKLSGGYGIIWNDELDIEVETIYEEGVLIRNEAAAANQDIADAVLSARAMAGISQKELSARTGIDQSDISRIERGIANPSVATLKRLASGLGKQLVICFSPVVATLQN